MFSEEVKLKIRVNKTKGFASVPGFIINYTNPKKNSMGSKNISYKILTLLNGGNDVIIEANSALFTNQELQREKEIYEFINVIKEMNLDYRYRKQPSGKSGNIFSKFMGQDSNNEHIVFIHIPKDIWLQDSFKQKLFGDNYRYYLLKKDMDSNTTLDDLFNGQILDEDKNNLFRLIVFDSQNLCQLGVFGTNITIEELQSALLIK